MHGHPSRGAPARSRRWRRPYLAALVGVLAVGVAVAACGGGGGGKSYGVASLGGSKQPTATTSAGAGASSDRQMALNWARCMRQHGINIADPQFSGDNIVQQLPDRAVRNSTKFKAAQQACRQYLPNGGQPTPPSAQERQQAMAFARCMRQHGINLPDPQITPDGIDQQPPSRMDSDDPRLKAAEQACHQYGALPPVKSAAQQGGGGGK